MNADEAVLKTLGYAKRYNCRLTAKEVKARLISSDIINEKEITKSLAKFETRLGKKDKNEDLALKIKKAEKLTKECLVNLKDVLMVGITGSVAAGYPKKNDDIDIMIITKRNKLWLTRLKLRWLIYKNQIPHRRYGFEEKKDEFCFNLWLDKGSLELPNDKQNLKNAMDLLLMKPIVDKEETYEEFVAANDWVKRFVATGYKKITRKIIKRNKNVENGERWPDKIGNILFFVPQKVYMTTKVGREKVGLHQAFFHP